jgi:4-amino-4-deoxychorismate lyase
MSTAGQRSVPRVWVDGVESDSLPVGERACQYGDGLFETLAVQAGEPRHWARHLQRLSEGCRRLGLPPADGDSLLSEARRLCAGRERAVLKILWSRGAGGRGYRPEPGMMPRRVLSCLPWPDYPSDWCAQGVRVRWCETRLGLQPLLAGIKHLNRLEQVLARAEWNDPQIQEGLMQDIEGRVIAGTFSNLFIERSGVLYTPELTRCGIAGVTRARVIDAADKAGLPVRIGALSREAVEGADALFLCNALMGLAPVRELDGRPWPVGELTRVLQVRVEDME